MKLIFNVLLIFKLILNTILYAYKNKFMHIKIKFEINNRFSILRQADEDPVRQQGLQHHLEDERHLQRAQGPAGGSQEKDEAECMQGPGQQEAGSGKRPAKQHFVC